MSNTMQKVRKFLNRSYLKYLMATELYMVEPWEKVVIHILFVLIFCLFWYFNYSIILNGVLQVKDNSRHVEVL